MSPQRNRMCKSERERERERERKRKSSNKHKTSFKIHKTNNESRFMYVHSNFYLFLKTIYIIFKAEKKYPDKLVSI